MDFITTRTPKTKNQIRSVPIPKNILSELEKHESKQDDIKSKASNMYNDNNIIFATDFRNYIDTSNLNRRFKKSPKRAEIAPIKFHGLRHTYATRLFENDIQPKTVSELTFFLFLTLSVYPTYKFLKLILLAVVMVVVAKIPTI